MSLNNDDINELQSLADWIVGDECSAFSNAWHLLRSKLSEESPEDEKAISYEFAKHTRRLEEWGQMLRSVMPDIKRLGLAHDKTWAEGFIAGRRAALERIQKLLAVESLDAVNSPFEASREELMRHYGEATRNTVESGVVDWMPVRGALRDKD